MNGCYKYANTRYVLLICVRFYINKIYIYEEKKTIDCARRFYFSSDEGYLCVYISLSLFVCACIWKTFRLELFSDIEYFVGKLTATAVAE